MVSILCYYINDSICTIKIVALNLNVKDLNSGPIFSLQILLSWFIRAGIKCIEMHVHLVFSIECVFHILVCINKIIIFKETKYSILALPHPF